MRKTQRKGDIGVASAIRTFTKMGLDVMIPLTESASYDLVIDTKKGLKRVQIKYSSYLETDLRAIHSNSKGYVVKKTKQNSYDWLYVYVENRGEFLIKKCLHGRRSVTLNDRFRIK